MQKHTLRNDEIVSEGSYVLEKKVKHPLRAQIIG
jgi:hypothetical protein